MASRQLCDLLEKLSKLKKGELPDKIKNPATGKMIKTDGKTFATLMRTCSDECGVCKKLKKNPEVNPLTGRSIKKGSAVYKLIVKGCDSCEDKMRGVPAKASGRVVAKAHTATEQRKGRTVKQKKAAATSEKAASLMQVHDKLQSIFQKRAAAKGRQRFEQAVAQKVALMRARKAAVQLGRSVSLEASRAHSTATIRKRAAKLNTSKGREYLEADEVEYILLGALFGGHAPANVAPVILDMATGGGVHQIRDYVDANVNLAVVYNNEHYVAAQIERDAAGLYTINYYEPFGHTFPSFVTAFKKALVRLNKGVVTGHLHSYALNWQKSGGPCGVYSAIAVHALATGHDLKKIKVRRDLAPPMKRVNELYVWISQNLENLRW